MHSSLLPAVWTASSWKQMRLVLSQAPLLDRSVWTFVWPIVLYLALFSLLPHKELRFIFNAIPILNMAAAVVRTRMARCILPFLTLVKSLF
jgi:alpha-1,6-mannosyltransferase